MSLNFKSNFDPKKVLRQVVESAKKKINEQIKTNLKPLKSEMAKFPQGKVNVQWKGDKADIIVTGFPPDLQKKSSRRLESYKGQGTRLKVPFFPN